MVCPLQGHDYWVDHNEPVADLILTPLEPIYTSLVHCSALMFIALGKPIHLNEMPNTPQ